LNEELVKQGNTTKDEKSNATKADNTQNKKLIDEVKDVLPLPNIDPEVLRKVIDRCEQHKNDPEPDKEEESKDGEMKQKRIVKLEGWDEAFIITMDYINEQGQRILFDIIKSSIVSIREETKNSIVVKSRVEDQYPKF